MGKDADGAEGLQEGLRSPTEDSALRIKQTVVHGEIELLNIEVLEHTGFDFPLGSRGGNDRDTLALFDDPLGGLHVGQRQSMVGKIISGIFLKPPFRNR